ncbi:MAG: phenylalanine--tRNA ligase subunit beta [Verrucomicrobiales bacterium]
MNVSLNWLRDHVDLSGYTTRQLDDLLTFAGIEVEGIAETDPKDTVFDLEITPNRPDLLSHRGIARELAALTGRSLDIPAEPELAVTEDEGENIRLEAPSHCPFYSARRIRKVRVGPSPRWLTDKLDAVGLRPINNIVDITNYVLLETGQPLHAFDAAQVKGSIVVRKAAAGEKFHALDEIEYDLTADDVLIADEQRGIALGGVIGGELSGVTESTTEIILESAYFTPPCIRRTSRRLNLSTDSSYRFERGVDPAGVLAASALATRLIVELAGGEPQQKTLTAGTLPRSGSEIEFDPERARALLGAPIEDAEMHGILEKLGLTRISTNAGRSSWAVPSRRLDLHRHIDLVEEIARVAGLDRIPSSHGAYIADLSRIDEFYDFLGELCARLSGVGFFECKTLKLTSDKRLEDHLLATAGEGEPLRLKNPLSDEHTLLRPTLLPSLLEVAERNVHQGARSLRLFEAGTVFHRAKDGKSTTEAQHLGLLLGGEAAPRSWQDASPRSADIFELLGIIRLLLAGATPSIEPLEEASPLALSARVLVGGNEIGRCGQLAPARARAINFDSPVLVAELDLEALFEISRVPARYRELDRFPAVTRDIAMEIPADFPNKNVETFFSSRQEPLLVSAELFDVFRDESGAKLAADKKSLAYSLTYRDKNATLTAGNVDDAHAKILEALASELPVQIR